MLLWVDSPLQVDEVCLVPLGSQTEQAGGGPSLQAFDIEGDSLFNDLEEWPHLVSSFEEFDGMVNHLDSLSAVLRALADAVKTKSILAMDSLSATLEV